MGTVDMDMDMDMVDTDVKLRSLIPITVYLRNHEETLIKYLLLPVKTSSFMNRIFILLLIYYNNYNCISCRTAKKYYKLIRRLSSEIKFVDGNLETRDVGRFWFVDYFLKWSNRLVGAGWSIAACWKLSA